MSYFNTSTIGDGAESLLLTELICGGCNVSIPFGSNNIYDLVVEHKITGKLLKVQIKCSLKDNFFRNMKRYEGEVDVVAFFVKDNWSFVSDIKNRLNGTDALRIGKKDEKNNWGVFGLSQI
jgi:hypothetical protein